MVLLHSGRVHLLLYLSKTNDIKGGYIRELQEEMFPNLLLTYVSSFAV